LARRRSLSSRCAQSFYAGVTRGERLVVLVGQKKAVAIAVIETNRAGDVGRSWTSGSGSLTQAVHQNSGFANKAISNAGESDMGAAAQSPL
jgi:hypothetical protein